MRRRNITNSLAALLVSLSLCGLEARAETVSLVCSELARGVRSPNVPDMFNLLVSPPGGIPIPHALELEIDIGKKKVSFAKGLEPLGGPFTLTVFDIAFVISSPNAAPTPVTLAGPKASGVIYGIDRRTGAYVKQDADGFVGIGVCSTKRPKF